MDKMCRPGESEIIRLSCSQKRKAKESGVITNVRGPYDEENSRLVAKKNLGHN